MIGVEVSEETKKEIKWGEIKSIKKISKNMPYKNEIKIREKWKK